MRVLLIKMSSMGDVFHMFPALTDAMKALPDLKVDWIVEEGFAEIPTWHPAVDKVYPIGLRRWRKHPFQSRGEIKAFFEKVNQQKYDLVLDAQGLLKSVWVAHKIPAPKAGMDWQSVREPLASLFYDEKYHIPKEQHAITRLRQLFSQALNYDWQPNQPIEYQLNLQNSQSWQTVKDMSSKQGMPLQSYLVGLHGTTWETKLWPEEYWIELGQWVIEQGMQLVLPWGNDVEKNRAKRIQEAIQTDQKPAQAWVPAEKLTLTQMAHLLKNAQSIVSVDTGLSHVAAALEVPMVVLYRVTDPLKVGAMGKKVQHLKSPLAEAYIKKFKKKVQETRSLEMLEPNKIVRNL